MDNLKKSFQEKLLDRLEKEGKVKEISSEIVVKEMEKLNEVMKVADVNFKIFSSQSSQSAAKVVLY
jgi:hypothetical protein